MISPVIFGAGTSAAPARPKPEELAQRFERRGKGTRPAPEPGESRVDISPEGAQRAQADVEADPPTALKSAVDLDLDHLDLAFAAADGNRDGTVTVSEQQSYEVRSVHINVEQPLAGRPGPAGSGPIRAYLDVDATIPASLDEA